MTKSDFLSIKYITQKEVEDTGANITAVKYETICKLSELRRLIGFPVILIKDGLTTGKHSSKAHPDGKAVDVWFKNLTKWEDVRSVFIEALKIGFNAIGIYWNGNLYSFHLELCEKYRFWTGKKSKGRTSWVYGNLIVDPQI